MVCIASYVYFNVQDVGKLRFQPDGVSFKSTASGRHVQVKHSDIDTAEWLRVAKGFGLKVMSREGNVFKFDGFKDSVSENELGLEKKQV